MLRIRTQPYFSTDDIMKTGKGEPGLHCYCLFNRRLNDKHAFRRYNIDMKNQEVRNDGNPQ